MAGTTIVITGTDTAVGKTLVTASLARALRMRGIPVRVLKPLATGISPGADEDAAFRDDDALLLRAAAGADDQPLDSIRLESWTPPLAPQTAMALDKRPLDYDALLERVRGIIAQNTGVLLIEGVGGVAVPITPGVLFSDFIVDIGSPQTIVVARSALGTINHTVLTMDHLRGRDIPVLGVMFTRNTGGPLTLAEDHGPLLAGEVTSARVLGLLEHAPNFASAQSLFGAVASLPWDDPTIQGVVDFLTSAKVA